MKNHKKKLLVIAALIIVIVLIAVLTIVLRKPRPETNTQENNPLTEQAAKTAHAAYVTEKPGHAGGLFLYEADGGVITIAHGATGIYKSLDEAKTALLGDATGDYFTTEVATGLHLLTRTDAPYVHAVPESQGVQNTISRAYQLTDIEWTPLAEVPGVISQNGEFTLITFEPGVTYQGIPYSGTTATDTYVGMNVSLTSFLTALKNPNSVLYTENLFSTNPKAASYYGTVCSKFVQYALDIPGSFNSQSVPKIPNVKTIASAGKYTVDQIKLGDIVVNPQVHTSICTDILYDLDGNIAYIEISEAVLPRVRRKLWSVEEFYEHFATYRLCRYAYIDDVPAAPAPLSAQEYALMPRFGDQYNYTVCKDKGVVDILQSGFSKAVILRDGEIIQEIPLNDAAKTFEFDCSVPGNLEMYLQKEDGTRSSSVYACVVESSVTVTNTDNFAKGMLTVSFEGSSGTPLYVQVGNTQSIFCSIENAQGNQATIQFPMGEVSFYQSTIRVAYQNEYGIYLSAWSHIGTE